MTSIASLTATTLCVRFIVAHRTSATPVGSTLAEAVRTCRQTTPAFHATGAA